MGTLVGRLPCAPRTRSTTGRVPSLWGHPGIESTSTSGHERALSGRRGSPSFDTRMSCGERKVEVISMFQALAGAALHHAVAPAQAENRAAPLHMLREPIAGNLQVAA